MALLVALEAGHVEAVEGDGEEAEDAGGVGGTADTQEEAARAEVCP